MLQKEYLKRHTERSRGVNQLYERHIRNKMSVFDSAQTDELNF